MPAKRPSIIAHHLTWTLYGHWLPNDPRGSGSEAVRDPKLEPLGEIHHGRKPVQLQPTRGELRAFYREVEAKLDYQTFWMDEAKRQAVGDAFAEVIAKRKYTVWACAILSNHAHMVIRRHRDDALAMWNGIADVAKVRLRSFADVAEDHPVWAARPYKVFLRTPDEVRSRVASVERNPEKEGLSRQQYHFVQSYSNWPFHKTLAAMN
jgi:REP element-mobilizing transposase RayT